MTVAIEVPSRATGSWPTHSHSAQVDLVTCEKRYHWSRIAKLPVEPSKAMAKGSFIHALLGAWWGGKPWQEEAMTQVQEWRDAHPYIDPMTGELGHAPDPEWMADMTWLMDRYDRFYAGGRDEVEVVAIERPFKVRVPSKYAWFTGRWDMLVRDQQGRLWVVEWKSMSDWDTLEQYVWAPQLSLYYWAAWADKTLGERPYGILLDALKTYHWVKDRPLEDSFRRRWLDRSPEQLDNTIAELAAGMVRARELRKGAFPLRNVDRHCGWCPFREPCRNELAFGDDPFDSLVLLED